MSEPEPIVDVAIPAFNEEDSFPLVLRALAGTGVRRIVVADNNSTDGTARSAREGGAIVVDARRQGYGSACLAALDYLRQSSPPDIVVFVDADYSDSPQELPRLVAPIAKSGADLVIGSRTLGHTERGALPLVMLTSRFGCNGASLRVKAGRMSS